MIYTTRSYRSKQRDVAWPPSLTVPNKAMTLRQIISKHKSGMPVSAKVKQALYDEAEASEGLDIKTLDYAELEDLAKSLRQRLTETSRHMKQKAEDERKRKDEAEIREKIRLEQEASSTNTD